MTDDLFGTADTEGQTPPASKPKPPTLYVINGNSRRARCDGHHCTAIMYWVPGRAFPITPECEKGLPPHADPDVRAMFLERYPEYAGLLTDPADGLGVNHYTNCPDAATFSGRNRTTGKDSKSGKRGTRGR